jgi:hypothetical protein
LNVILSDERNFAGRRIATDGLSLMPLYSAATMTGMSSDDKFDYQGEAVAAMKMAIAASGLERMKWVRLAQAWQDLGRDRDGRTTSARLLPNLHAVPTHRD